MLTENRKKKIITVLSKRQPNLTIVLENIWDPHNVSAILRTCDAVGVGEVYLIYNKAKFPRLGKKSSASALKWMKINKFTTVKDCYRALKKKGFKIYATHMGERAKDLYKLKLTGKVALVLGNEHEGLSAEAYKRADVNFLIPMVGMVQSLNVSVSAAICLYEAMRQKIKAGDYTRNIFDKKIFREWSHK